MEHKTEQAWQSWLAETQAKLGVVYLSGLEPETPAILRSTTTEASDEQMGDEEAAGDRGTAQSSETTDSSKE